SARLRDAAAALLAHRPSAVRRDTVVALAQRASQRWGAVYASGILEAPSAWLAGAADSITLARAQLAATAGRYDEAMAELADLYSRSTGATGVNARRRAADLMLARDSVDLAAVRAVLLPAISDPAVRTLLRDVRVVDV